MNFSRRLARPAYAAFLVAASSAISGCTLMLDFDAPIPAEDSALTDSALETSIDSAIDSSVDSGTDTEVDSGIDATETSVDADDAGDAADAADADDATDATDAADATDATDATDADDAADASDTAVDDAADGDVADGDATDATDTAPMCTAASECPGVDTECMTRTCSSGVCGFSFASDGTAVAAQTAGDCKKVVCDGAGATKLVNDDLDVGADTNQCTNDVCTAGVLSHPAKTAGATCTTGGTVCDGAGNCVECNTTADCTAPATCNTTTRTCVAPSCSDAVKNGSETDLDCGGTCAPCALTKACSVGGDCASTHCASSVCVECITGTDCSSGVCTGNACAAATCSDTVKNGSESDIDCGGTCTDCALGRTCSAGTDCASGKCSGTTCVECLVGSDCGSGVCTAGSCAAATCGDGVKNGSETDLDCGGTCAPCALAKACSVGGDCASTHCASSVCVECVAGSDCTSGVCTSAGACAAAACDDGVKNGTETGIDCGGTTCMSTCALGVGCAVNADCTSTRCNGTVCVTCLTGADCPSGVCTSAGACAAASCTDTVKNGDETAADCGGSCSKDCEIGQACVSGADCETGICNSSVCAAPSVQSTTPADGAASTSSASTITVTFAGPMDGTTLTSQSSSGVCAGTVQVSTDDFATCIGLSNFSLGSGNTVATWTPAPALSYGSTYRVRVTTDAKDGSGNALASTYTSAAGFTTTAPTCGTATDVVISQVYGGGGNSGAAYKNDFVVLHNRGTVAAPLDGWSLQYASSSGTTWAKLNFATTATVAPGGYFLISLNSGGTVGADVSGADATGTIDLAGANGKVALVANTTTLTGLCPTGLADFVGYGTANCFEGTAPAPAGSVTNSVQRKNSGCTDSNANSLDFAAAAAAPRNSSTTAFTCCETRNESGYGVEADYCVIQFPTTDQAVSASGTTATIYGQIYEAGVTEAAGAPSGVTAQVGYGPDNVNPSTQSGWTWTSASWNTQSGNNDEYGATITAPAATGAYRYGYRFSLDGGSTWTYCDKNGAGANTGLLFETTQLPVLTVTP